MIHRKPNLSAEMNGALDEWDAARSSIRKLMAEEARMTNPQFYWLQWFAKRGGRARVVGHEVIMIDGTPTGGHPVITFLHLVAMGAIAGAGEELVITELGRRYIERTETEPLPL